MLPSEITRTGRLSERLSTPVCQHYPGSHACKARADSRALRSAQARTCSRRCPPLARAEQPGPSATHETSRPASERLPEDTGAQEHSESPSRKPELPYKLVAGLASCGAAITGYLTLERLTGGSVACPASGSCETILSSGYATVLGIPLSLLGMYLGRVAELLSAGLAAYGAVAGLAAWQALQNQEDRSDAGRLGVLAGSTALATTSACLLYLLATEFPGQTCTWCLASAAMSLGSFVAACSGFEPSRELAGLAAPGSLTAGGVALFLATAWGGVEAPQALANIEIPFQPTIVRTPSSPRTLDVARRLKAAGARMYGAFWCSHCQEQKVSFGREAQADLPYVECFPEGYRSGVQMAEECRTAKLQGFPLWIINGHRYEGEQSLSDLESALKKPAQ